MTDDRCRHCERRQAMRFKRGLCSVCYLAPGVRDLYPTSGSKFAPRREPTAAEVEAIVAEQSRPENLPAWWFQSYERD